MKKKRPKKEFAEEWHHRVPDFKIVYCGPKRPKNYKESGLHSIVYVEMDYPS